MQDKQLKSKDMTPRVLDIKDAFALACNRQLALIMAERRGTVLQSFTADGFACACVCNVPGAEPTLQLRPTIKGISATCDAGCQFDQIVEDFQKSGFSSDVIPWLPAPVRGIA